MAWYAKKALRIGGKPRNSGEPVPEAEKWRNRGSYVAGGHIEWRDDVPVKAAPPTPAVEAPGESDVPENPETPEMSEEDEVYCYDCNKEYASPASLKRHRARMHA